MEQLVEITKKECEILLGYVEHMNSLDELYMSHFQSNTNQDEANLFNKLRTDRESVDLAIKNWWSEIKQKYMLHNFDCDKLTLDFFEAIIYRERT